MKLGDIARALPAKLIGDPSLEVRRVVHPLDATEPSDLAVALSKEAAAGAARVAAGALLIPASADVPPGDRNVLVYGGNDRVALSVLTRLFDPGPDHATGVHPTAVVSPDATLGKGVAIGPHSVVGARTRIGAGTVILAKVIIGADVTIGEGGLIYPGVYIGDRVQIGARAVIQATAAIGTDGFSFLPVRNPDGSPGPGDMPTRIHSLGTVIIADDVEIGAGTTIDRATLRATRIGRGTKIDNQVQIAHNVTIGEACLICGVVGMGGGVEIGDRTIVAGAAGLSDHVKIGKDALILGMAGVTHDVPDGVRVFGLPAQPVTVFADRQLQISRIKALRAQVKDLRNRLDVLEKAAKGR